MMRARCPACETVFRVRPEQLRARQGRVRCGHCQTAFNALDHLLEDEGATAAEASTGAPTPPTEAAQPPAEASFLTLDEPHADGEKPVAPVTGRAQQTPPPEKTATVASLADRLDFDIPETLLPARKPAEPPPPTPQAPAEGKTQAAPAVIRPAGRHGGSAAASAPAVPGGPAAAASTQIEGAAPPARADAAPEASTAAPQRALEPEDESAGQRMEPSLAGPAEPTAQGPGAAADDRGLAAPADQTTPWDDIDEAERLDATYGRPATARGGRRWLWGMGTGILLGVLAVQAAYLFRSEITRTWPVLRTPFLAACEELGCTLPLPREAQYFGIETSDLESEPTGGGRYVLNAVIRNRAGFPQAWPHLELTLTDARDLPAARRVIKPEEWVPQARLDEGFPAGATQAVRLPFDAPEVAAVGYRVYAFYP